MVEKEREVYNVEQNITWSGYPHGDGVPVLTSRPTRHGVPELWKPHTRIFREQKRNWRKFARLMPNMDSNGPHLALSSSMNRSDPYTPLDANINSVSPNNPNRIIGIVADTSSCPPRAQMHRNFISHRKLYRSCTTTHPRLVRCKPSMCSRAS